MIILRDQVIFIYSNINELNILLTVIAIGMLMAHD